MHNPAYLMLSRHSVYYFRWPIPQAFRTPTTPRHIALSLGTRKPDEALRLSRVLEYHASLLIRRYGQSLMNHNEMKAVIKQYLEAALERHKQGIREKGPLEQNRIDTFTKAITEGDLVVELAAEDMIEDEDTMSKIIEMAGLKGVKTGSDDYQKLRTTFYKALPAMFQEVLRFNQEQENFDFTPLQSLAQTQHKDAAAFHPLDKMAEKFVSMQMQEGRWDYNTEKERLAHIEVLKEIIGSQFDLTAMNAEKARYVRDTIKRMPKNKNKDRRLKELTLLESLKVSDIAVLAPATVSKYLETFNSLFAWAVDEGYIEKNYFLTLRVRGNQNNGEPKRTAFTDEQIHIIRNEVLKGRAGLANRDYRYWGTLIGMYTGARLNEIAQIMLADIKQDDGVWYFDMNDDGDNKKLKTQASRRYVPIHDELLKLGIIEYSEKLKRQGKERLFPELTFDKKNGFGKKLGHFFNVVLLPKLGLKEKHIVFHCFRHTAITRLVQANEEVSVVQAIVGHTKSGTALNTYFQEDYKLARLQAAINKLHAL